MPTLPSCLPPESHLAASTRIPDGLVHLRQILDSLDVFVGLLTPDGTLIEANHTALAAASLQPEDVLDKPFEATYWWAYSPVVQAQLRAAIQRAARGERVQYDVVVRVGDDHYITIDFRLVPLFDPQGRVQFLIPSAVDITDRLRTDRQLRESEERFRATFEQAAVGIAHVGVDGHWLRVNQKLCDIVGYTHDELLQRTFQDITYPPDLDADLAYARQLLAGEIATYSMEKRYVRRDGSLVWINLTGSLVRDAAGAPSYFIAIVEDITARKRAEETSRQSEARFRAALAGSPVTVFNQDRDLRYTWIYNPALRQNAEAVLGKTDAELFERPDEVALVSALKRQVIQTGLGARQEVCIHTGGEAHFYDLTIEALRDDSGQTVGVTCAATDITDRKEAEERQRLLAEASAVLSSSLDYETTLQGVARLALPQFADYCAVYLLEEDERIRQVAVAHVDPAKEGALREGWRDFPLNLQSNLPIARVVRTGQSDLVSSISASQRASLEQAFLAQQQTTMVRELPATSYIIVPLIVRQQVVGGLAFVWAESERHYDADDLNLAQELAHRAALAIDNARLYRQAQEAVQVREEFLSIASHELKTPITSLQLQMQLLLMHTRRGTLSHLPAERLAKILETGQQQVKRLAILVNDLLDVSRISALGLELRRETTDLAHIVETVVERFGPEAAERGSVLHVYASPAVGDWDPNRLEQVAVNLLSNAIKYGAGRPIEVSVTATPTSAHLIVRDQGIGIPPDRLPHIFNRFERAVADMTYSGIGLGLYITRQIVEAHGGRIRVESVPGQGSTFTVELPLIP